MDLPTVKAAVKAWEKRFKAEHSRDPTKDDIKRDTSDIAGQYALYRKLSKAASQPAQSKVSSQSQSSSTATSNGKGATPRLAPASEDPATPTPPSRRSTPSVHRAPSSQPSFDLDPIAGPSRLSASTDAGAARSLKRTASKASLSGPDFSTGLGGGSSSPRSRPSYITPKKSRPYTGPIHDPNPINPFAVSPMKPLVSTHTPDTAVRLPGDRPTSSSVDSPFIHADSPKKLREMLEANSLRKVKERMNGLTSSAGIPQRKLGMEGMEITPKTRARKRLRGEAVEDTPIKDRVARRRRGEGRLEPLAVAEGSRNGNMGGPSGSRKQGSQEDLEMGVRGGLETLGRAVRHSYVEEEGGEDEEGLGPSPFRQPVGKVFTALLAETGVGDPESVPREGGKQAKKGKGKVGLTDGGVRRGRPREMMGLFGRMKLNTKADSNSDWAGIVKVPPSPGGRIERASSDPPGTRSPSPPRHDAVPTLDESQPDAIEADESLMEAGDDSRLSTPPPDPLLEAAISQPTTSRSGRKAARRKVLTLEDEEEDEWDPEGGNVTRQLVIVPTRRAVRRVEEEDELSLDEVEIDGVQDGAEEGSGGVVMADCKGDGGEEIEDEDEDDDGGNNDEYADADLPALGRDGMTLSSALPSSPSSSTIPNLAPPLLSMLSLHSPSSRRTRSTRTDELRVKAIFDPSAASVLRAMRRGQEVFLPGEGGGKRGGGMVAGTADGEEGDMLLEMLKYEEEYGEGARLGEGVYEDDDWEEEDEGWKRTAVGLGLDDEW